MDIAQNEPLSFIAGETVLWEREFSDYPPADGWTLRYQLVKTGTKITFDGATVGTKYRVSLTSATTAAYASGLYSWQAYVTKSPGGVEERHYVDQGTIEIKVNYAAQTGGHDARSHVKKTLDALEAMLEGRASLDQQAYTIQGRSLSRMPIEELITWRDKYKGYYQAELNAEKAAAGLGTKNRIYTRFG